MIFPNLEIFFSFFQVFQCPWLSCQGSVTEPSDPSMNCIDLSNVLLPVKARTRWRPKGEVKRVIGPHKRSGKENDGHLYTKPRKRGCPVSVKETKDLPNKKECGTSLTTFIKNSRFQKMDF